MCTYACADERPRSGVFLNLSPPYFDYTYLCRTGARVLRCTRGGLKTVCLRHFSPPIMWLPRLKSPFHQPSVLLFETGKTERRAY